MRIGPYEVREELGRGGMGVVYRAWHPELGREVALKLLVLPGLDPELARRFETEGQAVARLRHPNAVAIHAHGRHEGQPYLVMDLIEGESLEARLRREGPLSEEAARRIGLGLARVIAHAHERGVVHRDLKPANVLIDRRGEPVMIDFGLARLVEGLGPTVSGEILGSPAWIAPEQAEGRRERIGPASDVWGLGALLFHLLSGRPPHLGNGTVAVLQQALTATPPQLASLREGIDPGLSELVEACLRRDPSERPTASQVAARLARAPVGAGGRTSWRVLLLLVTPLLALAGWFAHGGGHSPAEPGPPPPPAATAPPASAVARSMRDPCGEGHAAVSDTLMNLSRQSRSGRPEEAMQGYERLLLEHPGCPQVLVDASLCLLRISDAPRDTWLAERALELLEQALELAPESAGAWQNRAIARSQLGRHAEAIEDANRAIELAPRFSGAWAQRAWDRTALGELDAALSDLDRALELDGKHTTARRMRSELRLRRGELEGAFQDAVRGLSSRSTREPEPELAQLYLAAGRALLERARRRGEEGKLVAARADLDLILAHDPEQVGARIERAKVRHSSGDLAGAVEDLEFCLALPDLGPKDRASCETLLQRARSPGK